MSIRLRQYQTDAIKAFREFVNKGGRRGMIVLPCGTGKTVTGLSLARQMNARTLWIAHREELITQPIKALRAVWPEVKPGVVKAERNEFARDFVFASVQTACLDARLAKLGGFDLVVIDECHRAPATSYLKILKHLGCFDDGAPILLGLTATPERTDIMALDSVFESIVYQLQLKKAVADGYLVVPSPVCRKIEVDLDAIKTVAGDLAAGQLDDALLEAGIVDEVCNAVDELARNLKTIIFTVSVKQAHFIADELKARGYAAIAVSGKTPKDERTKAISDFAKGDITHVVNVGIFVEGFDEPTVQCVLMARPTKSKVVYMQAVGRGLRISPGKDSCLLIDMVGVSKRHNMIQAPAIFGLESYDDKDARENADGKSELLPGVKDARLQGQVKGLSALGRSKLKWIQAKENLYVLNCGDGGNIMLRKTADGDWVIAVVNRKDSHTEKEPLTHEPIDLELAQGIAEDYVRRSNAVYLSARSASWRDRPASTKQIDALKKWRIEARHGVTAGEASDLMTAKSASSWKNDPATPKQITALRKMNVKFDQRALTKGVAGKLLFENR